MTAVCIHHFLLESPDGPTSVGVCKRCGVQREFTNATPEDIDKVLRRTLGVKNITILGRRLGRIKEEAAALVSERPPGWARFD